MSFMGFSFPYFRNSGTGNILTYFSRFVNFSFCKRCVKKRKNNAFFFPRQKTKKAPEEKQTVGGRIYAGAVDFFSFSLYNDTVRFSERRRGK
ncbi:MAG TPA: hypothetical protein DDY70_04545 [Clostridiales bacterium]|nr:hypothetical protein [Clostridiales bacterium]